MRLRFYTTPANVGLEELIWKAIMLSVGSRMFIVRWSRPRQWRGLSVEFESF